MIILELGIWPVVATRRIQDGRYFLEINVIRGGNVPTIEMIQNSLRTIQDKVKDLQYGSIEMIIINGEISRIDLKESVKPKDKK